MLGIHTQSVGIASLTWCCIRILNFDNWIAECTTLNSYLHSPLKLVGLVRQDVIVQLY